MNKRAVRFSSATHLSHARFAVVRSWVFVFTIFSLLLIPAGFCAEQPDDQYVRVFGLVQQADALNAKGKNAEAKAKYEEAQRALLDFKRTNPSWNPKVVNYRIGYVAEKINTLSQPPPAADTGETSAPALSRPKTATPSAAQSGAAQVKLLEAGAEPRKALRLHPKPGDKQTLNVFLEEGEGGKQKDPSKNPSIRISFNVQAVSIAANGDINYEAILDDVGMTGDAGGQPQMVEAMKAAFNGMKGLQITGMISDRGQALKSQTKFPPKADPFVQFMMSDMADEFSGGFVFPEESVGPGARWQVKEKIKSQGMTIDQTSIIQLVSIDGDIIVLNGTNTSSAANQKISNPLMPQMKSTVTKMTGRGSAVMTVDMNKIMPLKATVEEHNEMSTVEGAGGKTDSESDMKIRMEAK